MASNPMARWITWAAFLACLSGCAPIPMEYSILDEIHLRFTSEDSGTSRILVSQLSDSACAHPLKTVELSSGDSTVIPGIMGISKWMPLFPHDRLAGFQICIEKDGRRFFGVIKSRFGYKKRKFKVVCDLPSGAKPTEVWGSWSEMEKAEGYCASLKSGSEE